MNYMEMTGDLFAVPQGYYLAHCISGDFSLGAGIAKQFDEVYNMRFKLFRDYPFEANEKYGYVGKALLVDNVFNLVTKPKHYHRPDYDTLLDTIIDMKDQCENLNITKLQCLRSVLALTGWIGRKSKKSFRMCLMTLILKS